MMVSNLVSLGGVGKAAGTAQKAGKAAKASRLTKLKNSFEGARDAVKSAVGLENIAKMKKAKELADEVVKAGVSTMRAVDKAMEAAEENIDTLANPTAARALALYFKPGSPNHLMIARNMGWFGTALALAEMVKEMALQAASFVDPTGIVDCVAAFAKGMCKEHTFGPMATLGLPKRTKVEGAIHKISSCNQCGINWCGSKVKWYPDMDDRYDVSDDTLHEWGCDMVSSSTKVVGKTGSRGLYAVEPYDLSPGDPLIIGTPAD
jgi:gas vesicle protein